MQEQRERTNAFWDGCRMAMLGHLITWCVITSATEIWHLIGHVVTSVAVYILEELLQP